MSTYNGQEWVDEQITSIINQDYTDWHLHIRDDGSTDNTKEILIKRQKQHPERITLYLEENMGVIESFNRLLSFSSAPYIAFSDQDDLFKSDKILKMVEKMQPFKPQLVHHDLRVVDQSLKEIHPSFWKKIHLKTYADLSRLLVQNVVTGCACLFNRPLLELATPLPKECMMHDHWMALVAAAFGQITAIDEPLTLYRQHGNNQIGAASLYSLKRLRSNSTKLVGKQAKALLDRYEKQLSHQQIKTIKTVCELPTMGFIKRACAIQKEKLYKSGLLRNLLFLLKK
jgi:glycosyltransferase involved in cell wall biosynthesis